MATRPRLAASPLARTCTPLTKLKKKRDCSQSTANPELWIREIPDSDEGPSYLAAGLACAKFKSLLTEVHSVLHTFTRIILNPFMVTHHDTTSIYFSFKRHQNLKISFLWHIVSLFSLFQTKAWLCYYSSTRIVPDALYLLRARCT